MSKSRDLADSAATINYIDGVTSNIQTQLDAKDSLPSQTGNTGKFLTTNGTAAAWDVVDVSSEITGTLPVANGGTGVTTSTGTGAVVLSTSPTLVTPALGTPSALVATNLTGTAASLTAGVSTLTNALKSATTTVSVSGATAPSTGQVLTATSGTAATWQAIPASGDASTSNPLSQFAATTSSQLLGVMSDETGTGSVVFNTSPTLVTPALGTPASGVATNLTGTAASLTAGSVTTNANLTGHVTSTGNAAVLGSFTVAQLNTAVSDATVSTGGGTATGTNTGDQTNISGNAATVTTNANLTGHVTSVGNAAVLGSFSSAQLATALSDETGSGAAVFGTSPTLVTPALGTPASGVMTNVTGTAASLTAGVSTVTNALKSATTTVNTSSATAPTAGQLLTATSGTAATWQDAAAAGGSVDIVASGSLPNGSVVQMNSNGTVSVPAISIVSSPTVTQYNSVTAGSSGCSCYDSVNRKVYIFWWDGAAWYCSVSGVTNNELSFTTTLLASAGSVSSSNICRYIPSSDQVLFAYWKSSYALRIRTVKADSNNVVTEGTEINLDCTSGPFDMGYDPVSGNAIVYYPRYSSGRAYAQLMSISGTTVTAGAGVYVTTTGNPDNVIASYDSTAQKHIVLESVDASGSVLASVVTVSGSAISVTGVVTIATVSGKGQAIYNSGIDRTVVSYKLSSNNYAYGLVLRLVGTTLTASSATQLNTTSLGGNGAAPVFYDAVTGKSYVAITTSMYELTATTSGVSLTTGTLLFNRGSYNLRWPQYTTFYTDDIGLYFSSYDQGPKAYGAFLKETSLRSNDVVGVVTSSYTNGQTATISTISSTATISGVAAATRYYTQGDGTLGTVDTGSYIGLGIGTNTLLVKG